MNQDKRARIEKEKLAAESRKQKHLHSLHHCLVRGDVMRHHHNALVVEMLHAEDPQAFNNVKKVRFMSYIAFWFTSLCGVIERYEQLRDKGAIPSNPEIDGLITEEFKDIIKPFRNSVAHCSDYDDERTIEIFNHRETVPDHAEQLAEAFHKYFKIHKLG